ncbi:hypothetical protein WAE61_02045 [Comamonadaceae bacterium PP-2]
MSAADSIRAFITPLLPGWRIQFGRWIDGAKTDRYAVIRPMGGMPVSLVRRPQFVLIFIGASTDAAQVPHNAAEAVIAAMRTSSGALVFMEPAEPVHWATDDGRPVAEIAVSTITN